MSDLDWLSVLVYIIDPDSPDEPELFMTLSGGRHMSKQKTGLVRGKKYILTVTADAPGVEGRNNPPLLTVIVNNLCYKCLGYVCSPTKLPYSLPYFYTLIVRNRGFQGSSL
jgi:hypothetical protein